MGAGRSCKAQTHRFEEEMRHNTAEEEIEDHPTTSKEGTQTGSDRAASKQGAHTTILWLRGSFPHRLLSSRASTCTATNSASTAGVKLNANRS
jgi:hypothetical protein